MPLNHVMTLRKFKNDTHKTFSRRNGAIKVIDQRLEQAHAAPANLARLQELRAAIDAFIQEKNAKFGKNGNDYTKSKRNKNGAIESLSDQVDQEIASHQHPVHAHVARVGAPIVPPQALDGVLASVARGQERLRRAPLPPPYKTMTNPSALNLFVQRARLAAQGWNARTLAERGEWLGSAAEWVHDHCNIPAASIEVKRLQDGFHGFFDAQGWKLQLSEDLFNFNLEADGTPNARFVYVCEIIYHEARHCEQWFHMARLRASQFSDRGEFDQEAWHSMYIQDWAPLNAAWARKMQPGDMLYKKTLAWYSSVYGDAGRRNIVLKGLGLRRQDAMRGHQAERAQGWGSGIHAQYSGTLAEEVDAWKIQDKVRAAFGPV